MARKAALLLQEPWCFPPETVARLTPWQVEVPYLELAAELSREASGKGGPGEVPDPFADGLPPRAEFIAAMTATDGGTPEKWNADYDRLEKELKDKADAAARKKPAR